MSAAIVRGLACFYAQQRFGVFLQNEETTENCGPCDEKISGPPFPCIYGNADQKASEDTCFLYLLRASGKG